MQIQFNGNSGAGNAAVKSAV